MIGTPAWRDFAHAVKRQGQTAWAKAQGDAVQGAQRVDAPFPPYKRSHFIEIRSATNRSFIQSGLSRGEGETGAGLDVLGKVLGVPGHAGKPARAPSVQPRQA